MSIAMKRIIASLVVAILTAGVTGVAHSDLTLNGAVASHALTLPSQSSRERPANRTVTERNGISGLRLLKVGVLALQFADKRQIMPAGHKAQRDFGATVERDAIGIAAT